MKIEFGFRKLIHQAEDMFLLVTPVSHKANRAFILLSPIAARTFL